MNPNERHNADVVSGEHWNEPDEAAAPDCEFCGETIQDFAKVGRYGCANCEAEGEDLAQDSRQDSRSNTVELGELDNLTPSAVPKLYVQRLIVEKGNENYVTIRATIVQSTFGVGSEATIFEQAIGERGELFVDRMKGGARESSK